MTDLILNNSEAVVRLCYCKCAWPNRR